VSNEKNSHPQPLTETHEWLDGQQLVGLALSITFGKDDIPNAHYFEDSYFVFSASPQRFGAPDRFINVEDVQDWELFEGASAMGLHVKTKIGQLEMAVSGSPIWTSKSLGLICLVSSSNGKNLIVARVEDFGENGFDAWKNDIKYKIHTAKRLKDERDLGNPHKALGDLARELKEERK
jgi:hypothetical protein